MPEQLHLQPGHAVMHRLRLSPRVSASVPRRTARHANAQEDLSMHIDTCRRVPLVRWASDPTARLASPARTVRPLDLQIRPSGAHILSSSRCQQTTEQQAAEAVLPGDARAELLQLGAGGLQRLRRPSDPLSRTLHKAGLLASHSEILKSCF